MPGRRRAAPPGRDLLREGPCRSGPEVPLHRARPDHVDHLTWFTAESFGGPDRFTRELGFDHLIKAHRHLKITDEQRERFVTLYMEALDEAALPDDEPFREAVRSHLEFGARVALQKSWAETDADLDPLRYVPRWQWPATSS